jgi:drug/metabolite transporter (DMT)-like permease
MSARSSPSIMLPFDVSIESNVIGSGRQAFPTAANAIQTQARVARTATRVDGMVLAAIGVLTFSFTLPMTKIAVRGIDPLLITTGRGAAAAVLATVLLRVCRCARPDPRHLRGLVAVVCGVVIGFPLLTSIALRHVPSSHGAVIVGLLPLATAGCAVVRGGERPSARYWGCSILGLAAVVWFALGEGGGSLQLADALLLGAVLCAAVGYTEGAILARELGGWQVICWALVLAAPVMVTLCAVVAFRSRVDASLGQWSAFGYTAMFSMFLGFFAWYGGLARAGIARAGQLQLAQPLLSVLWGWPMLGEPITARAAIAATVVLAAVALGRRAPVRDTVSP